MRRTRVVRAADLLEPSPSTLLVGGAVALGLLVLDISAVELIVRVKPLTEAYDRRSESQARLNKRH